MFIELPEIACMIDKEQNKECLCDMMTKRILIELKEAWDAENYKGNYRELKGMVSCPKHGTKTILYPSMKIVKGE